MTIRRYSSAVGFLLACSGSWGFAQQPAIRNVASFDNQYVLGVDSQPKAGVPEGKVAEFTLKRSRVFPGFEHKWWLYIPAQYNGERPLALMVFQDGHRLGFAQRDGEWRVPVVLDNLIAANELPPMAAVFVDPGLRPGRSSDPEDQRSVEYDTLNAAYANFLEREILPQVRKYVRITDDPDGHAIAGRSSGGIAAFTAAWQHPDQFRKVLSANGSFVNIRGGGAYPDIVRRSTAKPIRVFQQDGLHDVVDGYEGLSWPDGNKAMAAALADKGYDHQFVMGEGTHSGRHGAAIFPDAMRWLWRDYPR
jgi:enterochelin esterase family protein